jgi:cell division protein FtsW
MTARDRTARPVAPSPVGRRVASARHAARRRRGTHLPATRRRPPAGARATASSSYLLLAAVVAVLNLVGLVMVLSASSVEALREYGTSWAFFGRQLLWVALGAVALVLALRVDYRRWDRLSVPLMAVSVGLLVVVLVPGVGVTVGGATRWLGAGPFRVQPSELAKLACLCFAADLLARRVDAVGDWRLTTAPVLAVLGLVGGLVMLQPDMGTSIVLATIALTLLFVAGTPVPTIGLVGLGAAFGGLVLGLLEPYRRARLTSFLNPWADAGNTGYQIAQSLIGQAEGGIRGVGLGASRAKWGFLPNAHTDFIFAILGEELGLLGGCLVVALFVVFAVLGVRTAMRAPDRFGMLVAAGVTAWVGGQAIVNIGAVIGLLPVTGVPLPFVSFGGSSLVITMAATGILLNVARQAR